MACLTRRVASPSVVSAWPGRVLIAAAVAATKLLEVGELEARLAALEAGPGPAPGPAGRGAGMPLKRRLERAAGTLTPPEAIAEWFAEAHAFPTFTAYMSWLLEQPKASYPSVRLPLRAAESVELTLQGCSRPYITPRSTAAMLAAASDVVLVGIINAAVEDAVRFEGVRAVALVWWHRALRLEQPDPAEDATGEAGGWSDWRRAAEVHHRELWRIETARRAAEAHHFGGRRCLFPELAAEWARLCDGRAQVPEALHGSPGAVHDDVAAEAERLRASWELQA
jgi:hypothetical protein